MKLNRKSISVRVLASLIMVLLLLGVRPFIFSASATRLGDRSVQLTSNLPSDTATYDIHMTNTSPDDVGSVLIQICSNSPLLNDPCSVPAGIDLSHALLTAQVGMTGFTIGEQDNNSIVLTRAPQSVAPGTSSAYMLDAITNPSAESSYYIRLETFGSTDASGAVVDEGGLAFEIGKEFTVSASVPPFLLFCTGLTITNYDCSTASGDYLNLGELSANKTATGESQMLSATNAQSGYSIALGGTTLTSGNDVIAANSKPDVSRPGTSQFGINIRANGTPATGTDPVGPGQGNPTSPYGGVDHFTFVPNEVIATASQAEDYRKYTVSYIANISKSQAPGVYVSTITYVCLANF